MQVYLSITHYKYSQITPILQFFGVLIVNRCPVVSAESDTKPAIIRHIIFDFQ